MLIIKEMNQRYVEVSCDGLKYRITMRYGRPSMIYCLMQKKYVVVPRDLDLLAVLKYDIFKVLVG